MTPWNVALTVIAGVVAVAWMVPLWMALTTAMKGVPEYVRDATQWTLPRDPATVFANAGKAWETAGLGPGFAASLGYGVVGAALAILFGSLGAYALTHLQVRGRFPGRAGREERQENRFVVQFRLETYNTFNHAEFNSVNNTATFATAATAGSARPSQSDSTFGRMNGTLNPRYLQLALRVNF